MMNEEFEKFLKLVLDQNSSDNNVRTQAELDFTQVSRQDPTQSSYILIELACNDQLPTDIKQSCLLHLKRFVPKFWSLGFESFVGPPISQELKQVIRDKLIQLATSSPESKIRAGSAYVITQIAAADYPDEWPNLLKDLYELTTRYNDEWSMIGGLSVLNELFDDLITEEQFWDGGVGTQLINHIIQILSQESLNSDIKSSTLKFYKSVFNTLQSPEAFNVPERLRNVHDHITTSIPLFLHLLENSMSITQTPIPTKVLEQEINLRTYIYDVFGIYFNNFNKKISGANKESILYLLLKDFEFLSNTYYEIYYNDNSNSTLSNDTILSRVLESLFPTLSALLHTIKLTTILPEDSLNQYINNLAKVSVLPVSVIDEYETDFNSYVTDVSGISIGSISVRECVSEFLTELNSDDSSYIFKVVLKQYYDMNNNATAWQLKETNLFLLESLFMNEESESIGQDIPLVELFKNLTTIDLNNNHPLTIGRAFLVLPRFLEKFESKLSFSDFGIKALGEMIQIASSLIGNTNELYNLAKVSTLISITYYNNIGDLKQLISNNDKNSIQISIFNIILSLIEDGEDDSLPILLEAIIVAIKLDEKFASQLTLNDNVDVIDIIFKVSFKDPSNVQLSIDSNECLTALLQGIESSYYVRVCEKSLPFIFNVINNSLQKTSLDYVPELDLSLDLLSVIIGSAPGQEFPNEVFLYTFPILKNLILSTTDDQILQNSGEVFNNLLQKALRHFIDYNDSETGKLGIDLLLMITSKFLSPELSDSAALNSGSIVLSILEKFQSYLSENFQSQLLEATVKRLIIAKEVITIENLILVFCKIVLNSSSPQDLVNFLFNNVVLTKDHITQNGLELILPIWFNSFEITRGYELIKANTLALGKLFSLGDERIESMIVNGDIIPYQGDVIRTRSMARSMPDEYTKIPAALKILKLFVSELNFQCQQPDADDYLPLDGNEGDDDEGWEDMDDIGVPNYEKLKSYVDEEEEEGLNADEDLKNILILFFKECLSKNLGHFQTFYEMLDDDEKKIVTENVVF